MTLTARTGTGCVRLLFLLFNESRAGFHCGPHAQVAGHGDDFGQILAANTKSGGIGEIQQREKAILTETWGLRRSL